MATLDDRPLYLRWRNDPCTIKASGTQRPVTAKEHERWFSSASTDPDRVLMVIEEVGIPVGQIRIERLEARAAELHIGLDERARGRGIASRALRLAIERARELLPGVVVIVARVRSENRASLQLFTNAQFQIVETGSLIRLERRLNAD